MERRSPMSWISQWLNYGQFGWWRLSLLEVKKAKNVTDLAGVNSFPDMFPGRAWPQLPRLVSEPL